MILQVFAVYDAAAIAYLPPFFMPTKGLAIRSFMNAVADKQHVFAMHAKDYTLFKLGDFDDLNGMFSNSAHPEPIISALEAVAQNQEG